MCMVIRCKMLLITAYIEHVLWAIGPTGSIAPNSVVNKLRVSYNNNCRVLLRLPIVPVECLSSAIVCHFENF